MLKIKLAIKKTEGYPSDYVSVSLVDVVVDKIRTQIYKGVLKPGQKLIIRELSEMLEVSHTPIKDALNRLVAEGYVEALPRKSMVVRCYTNTEFVEDLYLRLIVELAAVPDIISAAQSSLSFLDDMKHSQAIMEDCLLPGGDIDYQTWISHERKFHFCYMKTCDNLRMYNLYRSLDSSRQAYFTYLHNELSPFTLKRFETNVKAHRQIVEAIEQKDEYALSRAIVQHIVQVSAEYEVSDEAKSMLVKFKRYTLKYGLD